MRLFKCVTQTNDGRVCGISGVVIYDRAYSDMEFLDTLVLTDAMPACNEFAAEMTNTVKMMLSSAFTLGIRRRQLCQNMLHFGHELRASSNFVLSCMAFAKTADRHAYLYYFLLEDNNWKGDAWCSVDEAHWHEHVICKPSNKAVYYPVTAPTQPSLLWTPPRK